VTRPGFPRAFPLGAEANGVHPPGVDEDPLPEGVHPLAEVLEDIVADLAEGRDPLERER
jgi:hypothetical protein